MESNYEYRLLENIHLGLKPPTETGKSYLMKGTYKYFHYCCDGFYDHGFGCAYRTMQSVCSWILSRKKFNQDIPSIRKFQQILIDIGDKPETFLDSKEWIGTLEVFYIIDTLYNISCKILHIPAICDLKKYASKIKNHFEEIGGLIMMGGDYDASSKGICGIHIDRNQVYLLILDPHFIGENYTREELQSKGYVRWQNTSDFIDSSFYNLCLPQLKYEKD